MEKTKEQQQIERKKLGRTEKKKKNALDAR
jgi:hypothetical protein